MTTDEMLFFSGGVLGPALVAQTVGGLLRRVPELAPPPPRDAQVDRLLGSVFPEGLEL